MRHISLLLATWEENLGDELLLVSEIMACEHIFSEQWENIQWIIFSHNPEKTREFMRRKLGDDVIWRCRIVQYLPHNIRRHPLRNMIGLYENMRAFFQSDLVILGGGWILYERDWIWPKWLWAFRVALLKVMRKKFVWWGIGISDKKLLSYSSSLWWKWLFAGVHATSVRDRQSYEVIKKYCKKAYLIHDPVINQHAEGISKHKKWADWEIIKLWISLRWPLTPEKVTLLKTCKKYADERGGEVICMSHSFHVNGHENDYEVFCETCKSLDIRITRDIYETYAEYDSITYMISMRLHGLILAMNAWIPALWYAENTKTKQFCDEYDIWILDIEHGLWRQLWWAGVGVMDVREDEEFYERLSFG